MWCAPGQDFWFIAHNLSFNEVNIVVVCLGRFRRRDGKNPRLSTDHEYKNKTWSDIVKILTSNNNSNGKSKVNTIILYSNHKFNSGYIHYWASSVDIYLTNHVDFTQYCSLMGRHVQDNQKWINRLARPYCRFLEERVNYLQQTTLQKYIRPRTRGAESLNSPKFRAHHRLNEVHT